MNTRSLLSLSAGLLGLGTLAASSVSCVAPGLPHPPGLPLPPLPGFSPGSSDAALKENVSTYSGGLDKIREVRPVTFDFKTDNPEGYPRGSHHVGVIAQDVEKAYPEAVTRDENGYRVVDPAPVFWSAVNAIQKLEAENRELRARVESLEKGRDAGNR